VTNTIYTSPITRSGFVLGNVTGDERHFHELNSTLFPSEYPSNGTGILANDRDSHLFVEQVGQGAFVLSSVDVSGTLAGSGGGASSTVSITGFLSNVQTGVINVPVSGSYVNVSGTTLGTVDRLVFHGFGPNGHGFVSNHWG
jgi:hypothetical protein